MRCFRDVELILNSAQAFFLDVYWTSQEVFEAHQTYYSKLGSQSKISSTVSLKFLQGNRIVRE